MTVAAVKFTDTPAQIIDEDAVTDTKGVSRGDTFMVTALLVSVAEVTQLAFEVSTHSITSPLFNVLSEKTEALLPTFIPFFFH